MGELKKRLLVAALGVPTVFLILTNYTACCFLLLVSILLCYREFRTMSMIMMCFATGKEESGYIAKLQSNTAAFVSHLVMPLYCIMTVSQDIRDLAWNLLVGLLLQATVLMVLRVLQYKEEREALLEVQRSVRVGAKTAEPGEEPYLLPKYRILTFQAITYDYFFMVFISLALSSGLHILQLQSSAKVLIWWFGGTWQTDNGCMIAGKLYGKRKVAQYASPNKTLEGIIGGYLLSALTLVFINLVIPDTITPGLTFLQTLYAALTFSTTAILGDLGESFVKRTASMKDASDLIPGHGGLLDRVDSLCLGCPVAFMLAKAYQIA